MTLEIRQYDPRKDLEQTICLYNKYFKPARSISQWQWEFCHPSGGEAVHFVLCNDNEIIGQMAALPIYMRNGSECILGARTQALVIDRRWQFRYAKEKLSDKLVTAVTSESFRRGIDVLWGFPLKGARRVFSDNGYQLHTIVARRCDLTLRSKVNTLLKRFRIHKLFPGTGSIPDFPGTIRSAMKPLPDGYRSVTAASAHELYGLWKRLASAYPLSIERDLQFLTWRFDTNPFHSNKICIIEYKGEKIGGFITGSRMDGFTKKGFIIDLLFDPENFRNGLVTMNAARNYLIARKCDQAVIWQWGKDTDMFGRILRRSGFKEKVRSIVLMYRFRDNSIRVPAEEWHCSMAGMEGSSF